ncbi:MAG: acyloxyacyl hydrolase [Flavobacteriales bacterium]
MNKITFILILGFQVLSAQDSGVNANRPNFFSIELLGGNTIPSSTAETKNEKGFMLNVGNDNSNNNQEWAFRLGVPSTGITLGLIDYGNPDVFGYSISAMPFIETNLFNIKNLFLNSAAGISFLTKKYNPVTNPENNAITTSLNWGLRAFFYYRLLTGTKINWRLGLGFIHQSNGHFSLPNDGLNSFFVSTSVQFKYKSKRVPLQDVAEKVNKERDEFRNTFVSFRSGLGANVFSRIINTPKPVYTAALSAGLIYNKTFKYSAGFYYRYYQQFYNYIVSEGELINEEYPHFKENPYKNATNFGLFISAEVILSHIGIETTLGYNIFKPFYVIERRVGQASPFISGGQLYYAKADLNFEYELKKSISARFGVKYYLFSTTKERPYNFYIGGHINGNFFQADFNEVNLGIVYNFNYIKK